GASDLAAIEALRHQWLRADFGALPAIEVLSSEALQGASGAYAVETDTIYLAHELLTSATTEPAVAVLLEEIGHGIDARLGKGDSPGDEGEIFSTLARGLELSAAQLEGLRQQDDSAQIVLDGQVLEVEQATLTVDSFADSVTNDGELTLREAIIAANGDITREGQTGAGADVITLSAGTFGLSTLGTEDAAYEGDLDITSNITIQGAGAGVTFIDANAIDRVFDVLGTGSLTLENVTVTGGSIAAVGGGIRVATGGSVVLSHSVVSGNMAIDGGGIAVSGSATVRDSTIANNSANAGGGIHLAATGTLTANRSTLTGNTAPKGGGVYVLSDNATIGNSTLSNNSANYGGGLYLKSGSVAIANSTISTNSATEVSTSSGGGIFLSAGTI
ncbi:MAG: hypothetical protein AAFY15_13965, partial [Cyanobacteria bacterium J06648_11]